jgi:hypothetical protein
MDKVEDIFKPFLQKNIIFSVDGKILKEGKLFLFSRKDYYLIFYLKINNQDRKFELPYPFKATLNENYIEMDYNFSSISNNDSELYYRLMSLNNNIKSRYLNNKITVFEKNSLDLSVVS